LNKNTLAYLLGLGLGDGHFRINYTNKQNINSVSFAVNHCIAQQEYLIWKAKLIVKLVGGKYPNISYKNNNNKLVGYKKEYMLGRFDVASKKFRHPQRLLYSNKKKSISNLVLNKLTKESISIWWMDDGCLCSVKNKDKTRIKSWVLILNTYLTIEENLLIINYFKKTWDITWLLDKHKGKYRLKMGTKEGRKFLNIVREFIPQTSVFELTKPYRSDNEDLLDLR
jgi:hypothetical protein